MKHENMCFLMTLIATNFHVVQNVVRWQSYEEIKFCIDDFVYVFKLAQDKEQLNKNR